tara:strand:- start:822 stop:1385 length:564 start_codon:yes stop_codon:yes gene_type:complete
MIRKIVPHIILLNILFHFLSISLASEQNWKPAQDGNKIIFIRHSLAPGRADPPGFKLNDCSTQRNLNQIGINQSKKIGKLFTKKKIKIDQVLSSQWCRCKDTARYAFGNFKEFSALNSTFSAPYDKNEKKQIEELKKFIKKWDSKGKNLVLVTHYVVILALTNVAPTSGELVITDKNLKVLSTISTF